MCGLLPFMQKSRGEEDVATCAPCVCTIFLERYTKHWMRELFWGELGARKWGVGQGERFALLKIAFVSLCTFVGYMWYIFKQMEGNVRSQRRKLWKQAGRLLQSISGAARPLLHLQTLSPVDVL